MGTSANTIKAYYMLTKPGIILGNAITTIGGFALASRGDIDYSLLLATLIGLSLVIASAGIFNNWIDREADAKMERTKNRPFVTQVIKEKQALLLALCLGIFGIAILSVYTNALTVALTITGFFFYVVVYIIYKYRSVHGTLIGSISGAIPPLVGYCAVSNRIDLGAILLFTILVLWQMPHFFAIALYRLNDYAAAAIPVLPVERGEHATKIQMLLYIIAFIFATVALTVFHYTGYLYLLTTLTLGTFWLVLCMKGFKPYQNNQKWAKEMFLFSLVTITCLCVMISIDTV